MLSGVSVYIYVAIGVAGLIALGAFIWLIWFRAKQNFEHGAETEKARTANERAAMSEAEVDIMRKQGEILARDESTEDTARSLDDGTF